jgi:hypothetical protein
MGREAKLAAEHTPYVVSSSLVCKDERFLSLYHLYHPGEAFAIALRLGVSRRSWSGRRRTSTTERLPSNRLCKKSMACCACNTSRGMGTCPSPISHVFPHRNLLCQPVGESLQVDLGQVSAQPGSQRSHRSRRCGRWRPHGHTQGMRRAVRRSRGIMATTRCERAGYRRGQYGPRHLQRGAVGSTRRRRPSRLSVRR